MQKPCFFLWAILACDQHAIHKSTLAGKGAGWFEHTLANFEKTHSEFRTMPNETGAVALALPNSAKQVAREARP